MKIALCDDEERCLSQVRELAAAYVQTRSDHKLTVTAFSHPEDLLAAAEKLGGFDIYVLDVVMPGMNGIRLGEQLREAGYDGKIIYLTSSEEYALDSFRVKAFHYLIKPIERESFFKAMDEAIEAITAKRDKSLLIKTKERSVKVTFDSILYAELVKRVVIYHLKGGKEVETTSLRTNFAESIQELLADPRFAQCGVGIAVNLYHITEIESEAITFADGTRLHLGKKICRELRGTWADFLFAEGVVL